MKEGNNSKAFFFSLQLQEYSLLRMHLAWQECSYVLVTFFKVMILYSHLVIY